jgi:hypothetical protein
MKSLYRDTTGCRRLPGFGTHLVIAALLVELEFQHALLRRIFEQLGKLR